MGTRPGERFYVLVDRAVAVDPSVRYVADDPREFADLRNAIVHERGDGHLIAEPHDETVARLEEIRRILEEPPLLRTAFAKEIVTAAPGDPICKVAMTMRTGLFSQVPVYDGNRFVGLLTAETITRWLGAMLERGIGLVEEAPVIEVLPHTEDAEHHCVFLPGDASAFDALDAFDSYAAHGWDCDAILVTETGRGDRWPDAIITTFDIPALIAAVGGRGRG